MSTSHPKTLPTPRASTTGFELPTICLCFFLSGVAALVYQIVWMRQFALVFGTSEVAVSAVLSAYMGGLALGAWLIGRHIRRVRSPVLWYVALEACIAVAALTLVPLGLWSSEQLLIMAFGGQPAPPSATLGGSSLFYLMAAFAILLVPTTLMGATLPLLSRHAVHDDRDLGRRIGLLYACNTSGAVVGALLGALLLLPEIGLRGTTWLAAALNVSVAAIAFASRRPEPGSGPDRGTGAHHPPKPALARLRGDASTAWVLPLMLISGSVSFLHEVLWTRMLSHILGSSVFAFGVMLGSFLAGIAAGGGLGAVLARDRRTSAIWLTVSELAAALAAVGAWSALRYVGPAVDSMPERVGLGFALLFPLALAFGLTYPLAVRVLASSVEDAAQASARVYSWNTVGAILGSIAAGFLVVPALRYEGSMQLAVVATCLLACAASFLLNRFSWRLCIPTTLAALGTIALFTPAPPDALLRYSPLQVSGKGELLYYDVGRSSAVVALRLGDQISLRTNGLPDATVGLRGSSPRLYAEAWMAPLATLARPQLQEMLVVGLGGGRVLEAVPPSVRHIDVIELEEKVIDANRALAHLRATDPLGDVRLNLIVNDARGALQLTNRRYDAVISQPSHPWTAGASHLYTREFMQQARDHLNAGGVFVQWMSVDFLDESLLRSLVATLRDVFPHVRIYRPAPPTLLFLASDSPIDPEIDPAATRAALAAAADKYGPVGLAVLEDLVVSLVLDDEGSRTFAADARVITDDANRLAIASLFESHRRLSVDSLGALLATHDPLLTPGRFDYPTATTSLASDYVIRRIQSSIPFDGSSRSRLERVAVRLAQQTGRPDQSRDPASALLSAVDLATRNDWDGVAALDASLSRIPWTSPSIRQAVLLRVEWRLRAPGAATKDDLQSDSIALIDRLNIMQPDHRLFLLRARSAGSDKYVLQNSLFRYSLAILQGLGTMDDLERQQFSVLQQHFRQVRFDDPVEQHHQAEVISTIDAVVTVTR